MITKIVSTEQIENCPKHSLSPQHYIDGTCMCTVQEINGDADDLVRKLTAALNAAHVIRERTRAAMGVRGYRDDDSTAIREARDKLVAALDETADLSQAIDSAVFYLPGDEG